MVVLASHTVPSDRPALDVLRGEVDKTGPVARYELAKPVPVQVAAAASRLRRMRSP